MCSIDKDDFDDNNGLCNEMKIEKNSDHVQDIAGVICHKCKNNDAIYKLQFREAECCNCFLLYVRHKFRATLGASKILTKNANILLIFDGEAKSLVLLDMVHHAHTQSNFKKLDYTFHILYIDDYILKTYDNKVTNNHEQLLQSTKHCFDTYEIFESYVIPMADVHSSTQSLCNMKHLRDMYLVRDKSKEETFANMIHNIKTHTSRQDFIKYHRVKLIAQTAKLLHCEYVFKADYNAELAADLLSAVCLGRGGSAALDVALMDDRLEGDIKLLRPLRNLSKAEIQLYLKARNLVPLVNSFCDDDDDDFNKCSSLQQLTTSFINNLQKNFNSTVTTIFRVGDKIKENRDLLCTVDDSTNELKKYCSFCNSILDHVNSTTLLSMEFSNMASTSGKSLTNNATSLIDVNNGNADSKINDLCHSCQNILHDGVQYNFISET